MYSMLRRSRMLIMVAPARSLFALFLAMTVPALLIAQVDSSTAEPDKLGVFGAVVDIWFWPVCALLQSGITHLFNYLGPIWKKISDAGKRTILYFVGLGITALAAVFHLGVHVDATGLQALGTVGVVAAVPGGLVAIVYALGRHKVNAGDPPASASRGSLR